MVLLGYDVGNLRGVIWVRKDDMLDGKKIRDFKGVIKGYFVS